MRTASARRIYGRSVKVIAGLIDRIRRTPPLLADSVYALAFFVEGALDSRYVCPLVHPLGVKCGATYWVVLVLTTLPLALRRRYPLTVYSVILVSLVVVSLLHVFNDSASTFAFDLALYTVVTTHPGTWLEVASPFGGVLIQVPYMLQLYQGGFRWDWTLIIFVGNLSIDGLVWFGAHVEGRRRIASRDLRQRSLQLEDEQVRAARLAIAEERAGIARELHALVTSGVDRMVSQARSAKSAIMRGGERARSSIEAIETIGRQTLVDMRRLLEVLRRVDRTRSDLSAQPGLRDLATLVDEVSAEDLQVTLSVDWLATVPQTVGLAVYRIVKEALMNARARERATQATVDVRSADHVLNITVEYDGADWSTDRGELGRALVGMRERTSMLGGELSTERGSGGGFVLRVRFPLAPPGSSEIGPVSGPAGPPQDEHGTVSSTADQQEVGESGRESLRSWLVRPQVVDRLLVLFLCTGVAVEYFTHAPTAFGSKRGTIPFLLTEVAPVALLWRRRAPLLVFSAITATVLTQGIFQTAYTINFDYICYQISIYSVAAERGDAIVVACLAIRWAAYFPGQNGFGEGAEFFGTLIDGVLPAVFGHSMRQLMRVNRELEATNIRLDQEREERVGLAVQQERARMARDMHDVVAHGVSVMVVQAGAAARIAARTPSKANASIEADERIGLDALKELHLLVGVLEPVGGRGTPSPAEVERRSLDELMKESQSGGLTVDATVDGSLEHLDRAVELSVYRIVQEALTNVRKHAGGSHARIRVRRRSDSIEVQVTDDGRASARSDPMVPGSGQGLVGMRERVAAFGGDFRAGPMKEGGFEVWARLPLGPQMSLAAPGSGES
jgi:signal transduction histidine kinase